MKSIKHLQQPRKVREIAISKHPGYNGSGYRKQHGKSFMYFTHYVNTVKLTPVIPNGVFNCTSWLHHETSAGLRMYMLPCVLAEHSSFTVCKAKIYGRGT